MSKTLTFRVTVLFLLAAAVTVFCVATADGRLVLQDQIPLLSGKTIDPTAENGCVRITDVALRDDPEGGWTRVMLTVEGIRPGEERIVFRAGGSEWESYLWVGQLFHFTLDYSTGNFSGSDGALAAVMAFLALLSILLWQHFDARRRNRLCAYRSVLTVGLALYVSAISIMVIYVGADYFAAPYGALINVWNQLGSAAHSFAMICWPFLLAQGIALTVSNVALVRHEGMRPRNLLGVWALTLLIIGTTAAMLLDSGFVSENDADYRLHEILSSTYYSVYVLLTCLWLGMQVCAWLAARHTPPPDRDYIIILGCQVGRDGKPLPLLRQRVDRAVDFAAQQAGTTGKQPIFVPSGGKGTRERVSEAESMRAYLVSRGIPDGRILPEDQSTNTRENMRFSRRLILKRDPEAKIAFCTTNYHVFRSGVLAAEEGLKADHMGSPTKWYFWPNALIREYIAFLAAERKSVSVSLALLMAFSAAMAMLIL